MSKKRTLRVVILAAGKGTRMKSSMPKLLHHVAGRPMIEWTLDTAQALGPEKIIVVIGPDMEALVNACHPHETALQPEQNGTGGAIKAALPALQGFSGDVLILLGDCPLITAGTLRRLITARGEAGMAVLGCRMPDPAGYGRLVVDNQDEPKMLRAIVEDKDATPKEKEITLINTGAFCIQGGRLAQWLDLLDNNNSQGEFYATQLPEIIAQEGGVTAVSITDDPAEVQGCNTRMDLAALERTAQDRLRRGAMEAGVTLRDPATTYLSYDTVIEPDVTLEPNVQCGPMVMIRSGAYIKSFSYLEGVTVGARTIIGPFARLRPGTDIASDVRIGNFVEVKKSTIGTGSKIGHLAYVGDCEMGTNVNFSAGAITVNYDGQTKHKTVIGDDVMVGSDVSLVAPLTVEDGAFIAAGSTITKDVPAGALSIARPKARILPGWTARKKRTTSS